MNSNTTQIIQLKVDDVNNSINQTNPTPIYFRKTKDEKTSEIKTDKIISECKEYASELICNLCENLLIDPILCDECQNLFCTRCITTWIQNSKIKQSLQKNLFNQNIPELCPLNCRYKPRAISKIIKNFLSKIKLYCKYQPYGCNEILTYDEYFNHLNNVCNYVLYQCGSEGCSYTSIEKDMKEHITKCEKSLLPCQYCNELIVRGNISNHESECGQRLLRCHFCLQDVSIRDYKLHETNCNYLKILCGDCKPNIFKRFLAQNKLVYKDTLVELTKEIDLKNKRIRELEKLVSDHENKIKSLDKFNIDLQIKLENSILSSNSSNIYNKVNVNDYIQHKFEFKDLKDLKNIKEIKELKEIKGSNSKELEKELVSKKIKDEFAKYKQTNNEFNMLIGMNKEEYKKTGVNCIETRDECKPDNSNNSTNSNTNTANKKRISSVSDLLLPEHNNLAWKNNIKNIRFEGVNKHFYWKDKQYAEYWGPRPFNESSFNHYGLPDKSIEILVVNDISKEFGKTLGHENLPHQCGRCEAILDSFSSFLIHLKVLDYIPKNSIINGSPFRYWLFWQNENEFVNFWYDENNEVIASVDEVKNKEKEKVMIFGGSGASIIKKDGEDNNFI